jgi:hypothetical protein
VFSKPIIVIIIIIIIINTIIIIIIYYYYRSRSAKSPPSSKLLIALSQPPHPRPTRGSKRALSPPFSLTAPETGGRTTRASSRFVHVSGEKAVIPASKASVPRTGNATAPHRSRTLSPPATGSKAFLTHAASSGYSTRSRSPLTVFLDKSGTAPTESVKKAAAPASKNLVNSLKVYAQLYAHSD